MRYALPSFVSEQVAEEIAVAVRRQFDLLTISLARVDTGWAITKSTPDAKKNHEIILFIDGLCAGLLTFAKMNSHISKASALHPIILAVA
jgi:hypothetical protein